MTRSNRFQLLDALWASINRIIAIAGKEFVALLEVEGGAVAKENGLHNDGNNENEA